jgi:hypothetical protein
MFLHSSFATLCVALLAMGCASTGVYQPLTGRAGYAETRLDDGPRWQVEFLGDEVTSRETVETYLLYRSAELTLENGYDWFSSSARETTDEEEEVVRAERADTSPQQGWRPQWRRRERLRWTDWDPAGPPEPHVMSAPVASNVLYSARAEIVMGRGPAPEGAFVARQTLADLGPAIARPPS